MRQFEIGKRYDRTCWFTGGVGEYECKKRTKTKVTFKPTYYEIDGIHSKSLETFEIKNNGESEYVVVQTYKGEENRMYA